MEFLTPSKYFPTIVPEPQFRETPKDTFRIVNRILSVSLLPEGKQSLNAFAPGPMPLPPRLLPRHTDSLPRNAESCASLWLYLSNLI